MFALKMRRLSCAGLWLLLIGAFTAAVLSVSVASAAEVTDVEAVPYINDKGRDAYRNFLEKSGSRAFVVSPSGSWSSKAPFFGGTAESAVAQALEECTVRSRAPCYLYAVGDKVVWDGPAAKELRELDTTKLGFSIDLPERWKRTCAAKALITDSMYFRACFFVDSDKKASVQMAVRGTAGDIRSWENEMAKVFITAYAWNGGSLLAYDEKASRSEEILLPNGIPAMATHKTYVINGHSRDVSHLTFALKDIYVWMAIYPTGETTVGPALDTVLAAIKLQ